VVHLEHTDTKRKPAAVGSLPVERTITVALAGQPNVGKTTVFNMMTGLNQHVGNWPGKTVEHKEGTFSFNGSSYRLVDLPGTYSLSANSPEEVIARDFIITARPDAVLAIINAASLERTLYLVAELLPLPAPVVIGLNMVDVAHQEHVDVEPLVLEAALGVRVVPMIASKNQGVRELFQAVNELVHDPGNYAPCLPEIRSDHRTVLAELQALITGSVPPPYPADWVALKLFEGDQVITEMMESKLSPDRWQAVQAVLVAHDDGMMAVASGRYDWIGRMTRAAMRHPSVGQIGLTERLDRILTHPVWGIAALLAILGLVFWITYTVAGPIQQGLQAAISSLAGLLSAVLAGAPPWIQSLVVDGVLAGAGTVITFVPILMVFFATMGILEDTGYMARAAFVMDRFMHLMGLHGRSFLPLFLGFGCSVPAVVGARVVDSPRARLLTIMLAPLVPCSARMALLAFLVPAFFARGAALVSWGLITMSIVVLAVAGITASRLVLRGERVAFIMELPLYHLPNARTIGLLVWQRTLSFIQKAATVIVIASVIIWALSYFPGPGIQNSYMAVIGQFLEPIGQLAGLNWQLMVALLASVAAKENAVATLGILYGSGSGASLTTTLSVAIPTTSALAYLAVQMLFVPCIGTLEAIRQEAGLKWAALNVLFLFVISMSVGAAVYALATLVS
jgi:ferrous iron transport protein B